MKTSDRKEMIREIFNEEEVVEIRAALSDRYENLIKMAQKEEKHGRLHDDHSWPQERLAILDGTDWRAGVISVFDPESSETKNGDLFDDQDDDLEETSTGSIVNRPPEYQNDPWDCPHTEILDETEEAGEPRFRCTLCGDLIRALAAPAGDDGEDAETLEVDYEIVDDDTPLGNFARGNDAYISTAFVDAMLRDAFPDEDPLPSEETISDWSMPTRWEVLEYAQLQRLQPGPAQEAPPMPEVLWPYLAPEELHAAAEGPPPPTLEHLDALTLEELGIPTRARNTLSDYGIKTAADYLAAGDAVLSLPGVGPVTLTDINGALMERGLTEQAAREIQAELRAQGRTFTPSINGGETEEEVEAPTGTLYDRVLSVVCPTCTNHGLGAGDVCVSVGGNPRNGFHAIRLRVAVRDGVISPDEYDAAYELQTLEDETDGPEDAQPAEDELPWERVGMALTES